jgi:hypothetical protein
MADERLYELIRSLDLVARPDPQFAARTFAILEPLVRDARRRDASRLGRLRSRLAAASMALRPAPSTAPLAAPMGALMVPTWVIVLLTVALLSLLVAGIGWVASQTPAPFMFLDADQLRSLHGPGYGDDSRSSDGKWYAVISDAGLSIAPAIVSATSGTGDVPGSPMRLLVAAPVDVGYINWSPDGTHVAWTGAGPETSNGSVTPAVPSSISVASVTGGEPQTFDVGNGRTIFEWSPDSRWIAAAQTNSCEVAHGLTLIDVANSEKRTVRDARFFLPEFGWSADGRRLAVGRSQACTSPTGPAQIDIVDTASATVLVTLAATGLPLSLSPDGRLLSYLAAGSVDVEAELHVIDTVTGASRRLTMVDGNVPPPQWSLDGRWIVFLRAVPAASGSTPGTDGRSFQIEGLSQTFELWAIQPDGTGERPIDETVDVSVVVDPPPAP